MKKYHKKNFTRTLAMILAASIALVSAGCSIGGTGQNTEIETTTKPAKTQGWLASAGGPVTIYTYDAANGTTTP